MTFGRLGGLSLPTSRQGAILRFLCILQLMRNAITSILSLIFLSQGFSQCRFIDRVFPSIVRHDNVVYGNAPQITPIYVSEATTIDIDLHADILEPAADTMQHRPVIIMAFAGGFFTGTKNTDDMQALADSFAHHGYVTCSMQYRLFFNFVSTSSIERAIYRAVQDLDALLRFLVENESVYKIDTNQIFFVGSSAGAFTGLHHIFRDENERPASTYSGILQPDLGCKSCSGNNYNHQVKIKAITSCWGAIADTSLIEKDEHDVPMLMFHGDADPIVPYGYGYPFTVFALTPQVYGSSMMNQRLQNENIYHEFYTGAGGGHEYWGSTDGFFVTPPNANWPIMVGQINQFFYNQLSSPPCEVGLDELDQLGLNIYIENGVINITSQFVSIDEILVFDIHGKQLQNKKIDQLQAEVKGLQKGIYILYVSLANKTHFFKISI